MTVLVLAAIYVRVLTRFCSVRYLHRHTLYYTLAAIYADPTVAALFTLQAAG